MNITLNLPLLQEKASQNCRHVKLLKKSQWDKEIQSPVGTTGQLLQKVILSFPWYPGFLFRILKTCYTKRDIYLLLYIRWHKYICIQGYACKFAT